MAVLVGVTLVLAACGVAESAAARPELIDVVATPTPIPPPPTAVPTATPAPTPTPTPTATPFAMSQALIKKLPAGWDPVVGFVPPVGPTDVAPGGGEPGPVDYSGSRWKYVGVLGRLKPKQAVVPTVADRPAAVANAAPLTGLPGPTLDDRSAVIVKIDNSAPARPQTGLNQADVVYEELVESGVTRFAAVFHSQLVETVGPVRSGRSTDIGILDSFRKPIVAFSGANSIFEKLIDKQPIVNRGAEVAGGYWRGGGRAAPYNMFTSTSTMLASAAGGKAPKAHFAFRDPGEALHPSAVPATIVRLNYLAGSGAAIEYRWSGDGWQRWQSGAPHVDSSGVQLEPENLIVQFVNYIDSGLTDKFKEDLYEGVSVGTGPAWVFTDGNMIEATWTRPTLKSAATFTDANGNHIELTPGQTFVSLIAPGGATWG